MHLQWMFSIGYLLILQNVHAISTSGSRLLVVIEDVEEKAKFSTFWSDFEGICH